MTAARKPATVIAVVAIGLAAWSGIAQATGTGSHGLTRTEYSSVTVDDEIRIKDNGGSRVTVASIRVDPGGHTPWHYHPGPHIVSVKTGTVRVYETDCSYRQYPAGTGFYDPGPSENGKLHVHTLWNPSTTDPAEVVITDVRTVDRRLTVVVDPQPSRCFD